MVSKMSKPKYPRGETVWTSYYTSSGELMFILTAKPQRDAYYLYELRDGEFQKLGRSKSPLELEEKFDVHTKLKQK